MSKTRKGTAAPSGPADQPARDKIVQALDTTFLVEAGAGSGKTQSLVDRMVALIASGRTMIQTLAAVTFTRKAAAELRGRFQVALEGSLHPSDPSWGKEERIRLAVALQNLEQGFIGTIHSFCAKLLRERPVEIGLDPEFEEMDELEDGVFREACWQDFVAKVRVENEKVLIDLDEVGLAPDDLKDPFSAISLYPEIQPAAGRDTPPDFAGIIPELEVFLENSAAGLPEHRPEKGYDGLQTLLLRGLLRRRNLGFSDHRVLMETLELFEKKPGVVKNRWRSKEEAETYLSSYAAFRQNVAVPALRTWREYRHSKVLAFLGLATAFYAAKRRAKSRLNFQDQLLCAARLLRENPEVRRYFRKRFRCILVDEFQDTDPVQAEILFYLAGNDVEKRDWTKIVPEPGSLFLVGDPKQSIYRFRRADIDVYNLVKEQIRAGGGEILELTSNFRSLDCIADWVNSVFKTLFPERGNAYQSRFARLRPVRRECRNAASGVFKMTVGKVERNREKDIAANDAAVIAGFISRAVADGLSISKKGDSGEKGERGVKEGHDDERPRPVVPGDFLILFHYKKNMSIYARELERSGIPFEISGSEAFSESMEIGEIINLLQALQNPRNPVLTVAVLRGLFFGVSDQELLEFKGADGSFSFMDQCLQGASLTGKVRRALQVMRGWWELSMTSSPSNVLESILENSGLLNYLVSSEMGSSRAGNVLKLIEVVRAREKEGMTSFAAVADFIREWVDAQALEEMSLTPDRRNAVRLMNLHKAKGLEAPVVILANPVGVRAHPPEKHIIRTGYGEGPDSGDSSRNDPTGYFLFSKRRGWQTVPVSHPVDWDDMAVEELKYEQAEENRLMYVAATRARDLLIISTYEDELGTKKAWGVLDDRLNDVEELEGPSPGRAILPDGVERSEAGARGKLVLKKSELNKARSGILSRKGAASRAGFLLETVTSLAREAGKFREWPSGGLGMSWGTAVHSVLSTVGKSGLGAVREKQEGPDHEPGLLLLAANALVAAGRDAGETDKLVALVRSIIESDFWLRARSADRAFFEIPFSVLVNSEEPEYREIAGRIDLAPVVGRKPVAAVTGAPLFLSGSIDLAFRETDGWVIADYKTEAIADIASRQGLDASKKALDTLVEYYTPQVSLYSRFWAKMTGERVKESGLYFTSLGIWKKIG